MKKILVFTFAMLLAFVLVACGSTNGSISVEVSASATSVKVGDTVQLTAKVTPDSADQSVTWASNKTATATVDDSGVVTGVKKGKAVITATSKADPEQSAKITITVTDSSSNKPDLGGYEIKIAYSPTSLYSMDPRMEYGGTTSPSPTRPYAAQAWRDIEQQYNCKLTVEGYPCQTDSERWAYILEQAKNNVTDFDIYWVPTKQISNLYTALISMDDLYTLYGLNSMNDADYMARKYKGNLWGWSWSSTSITADDPIIGFNVNLLKQIGMEEPGKLFLENKWNLNEFKEWCIEAQTRLNSLPASDAESKYYVISGPLAYYVRDMARTSGVALADTLSMEINITNPIVVKIANMMKELYEAGCVDPANQVDGSVASWNEGRALLCTGSSYWVDYANRWNDHLWGEETTLYGFAPWPYDDTISYDKAKWATYLQDAFVMPKAITEKIERLAPGNDNVTIENIYQVWVETYRLTREYIAADSNFDQAEADRNQANAKWDTEYSVNAWLYIQNNLANIAIFDPIKEITNCWSGDWAHYTAGFISPNLGYTTETDYLAAVTPALADLRQAFVEKYN